MLESGAPLFDLDVTKRPAPPRNYFGWILLVVLFTVSIGGAFASFLSSRGNRDPILDQYETTLKTAVSMRELTRSTGLARAVPERGETEAQSTVSSLLSATIDELATKRTESVSAARWYIQARVEDGKEILPKDLELVRKSKKAEDLAFANVYDASLKQTKAQVEAELAKLPKDEFATTLARVHALERLGDKKIRSAFFDSSRAIRQGLVVACALAVTLVGGIAWLTFFSMRSKGMRPEGFPTGKLELFEADRFAIRAALIFLAFIGLTLLGGVLELRMIPGASVIPYACIVALVLLQPRDAVIGTKLTASGLGANFLRFKSRLLWGVLGACANSVLMVVLLPIAAALMLLLNSTPSHPVSEMITKQPSAGILASLLLMASVAAPIWEEIFFRGLLFPAISRVTNSPVSGALISSLLFAMIHPQGPALWVSLAGIGVMNCALTYWSRSLMPAIILHMLHNTATLLLGLMIS